MNNVKTALITGATSGIGLELARIFAQNGWGLVLVARDRQRLDGLAKDLAREFKAPVITIPQDMSIQSAPKAIFDELQKSSIHVDILVNNAGFNEYGLFLDTDIENELRMIQLHIASLTFLTKLLLPKMVERKYGRILNVGSTGSFTPVPLVAVYCATKAYILSFSEAIAEELRGTGVTVTALCPGPTKTEFARRAKMEGSKMFQGSLMDAHTVAKIGFDALKKGETTIVPGCLNKLTVFSLRLLPRKIMARMGKNMMAANA